MTRVPPLNMHKGLQNLRIIISESILQRGEDVAWTNLEGVLRAGECAIGHILIMSFVKEVVGGKRQSYFAVNMPNG